MQASSAALRQEAHGVFMAQHGAVLHNLAVYQEFERIEGRQWPRYQRIVGGVGNAGELSRGVEERDVKRIREGHGDMWWTVHTAAREYDMSVNALAERFADARHIPPEHSSATLMLRIFQGIADATRYAAVLDGVRTFPDPERGLQESIGRIVTHLTLLVPAIKQEFALDIDPEQNVKDLIHGLDTRVPLQILYGKLREGTISRAEAEAGALALADQARRTLGLDEPAIEAIWVKAPTRVKGQHRQLPLR